MIRYIIILLGLFGMASAQYAPTSAKTKFVNAIAIGSKDTSTFTAADTMVITIARDSMVYYRYRGYWKPLGKSTTTIAWDSITGKPVNFPTTYALSNDVKDSIQARLRKSDTAAMLAPYVPYIGATKNVYLGNNGIYLDAATFKTTSITAADSIARIKWDTTYRTVKLGLGGGNVQLQIGQEEVVLVHNGTGATLTDGQIVYITGSTGELPSVALASDTSEAKSSVTLGVVTEHILNGENGFVTISGMVHGLNTNSLTEGKAIWLGTTPGTFTDVKPQAPQNAVLIGYVVKKAGGNGSIFVKIQNGYELDELHNVKITQPVLNQSILIYDSTSKLWVDTLLSAVAPTTDTTSLSNRINQKLNISDTAAMLSPYYKTSTATAALATKLNISDTTAMLSPYKTFYPRNAISLTTTGTSGAATYNSTTGVLNIPNYATSSGTVTSIATTAPITGGTITTSGTIGITQATTSTNGYLSSTDWNTFNNKQSALTNPITGKGTTNYLPKYTDSTKLGNSLLYDNGTSVGISNATPNASYLLDINGSTKVAQNLLVGAGLYSSSVGYISTRQGKTVATNALVLASQETASPFPTDLIFRTEGAAVGWSMQATNQGTARIPLIMNPLGGNVGIGTTTPGRLLSVGSSTGAGTAVSPSTMEAIQLGQQYGNGTVGTNFKHILFKADAAADSYRYGLGVSLNLLEIVGGTGADIGFFTNATNRPMTLTSGGRTLINTTTDDGSNQLQVSGTGKFTGNVLTSAGAGILSGATSYYVSPSATRGVVQIGGSTDQFLNLGTNGYLYGSSSLVRLLSTPDFDIVSGGSTRLAINSSTGAVTLSNLAGTGDRIVTADANGKLTVGTSTGTITSGTYTPTATSATNATSITCYTSPYTRVGNVITMNVSGNFTATTANTYTKFNLDVPVAAISVGSAILSGTGNISNSAATQLGAARISQTTGSTLGFLVESYPAAGGVVQYFSASIQYTLQ